MAKKKREPPRLSYNEHEYNPLCECERNIERAFDILFEAVLKREQAPLDVKPEKGDDGVNTI
jgi:hypothetical protein